MKKSLLIHLVRSFAKLSQQRRKSYAPQVGALLAQYIQGVRARNLDLGEETREVDWAVDFAKREYGTADKEFSFSALD